MVRREAQYGREETEILIETRQGAGCGDPARAGNLGESKRMNDLSVVIILAVPTSSHRRHSFSPPPPPLPPQ